MDEEHYDLFLKSKELFAVELLPKKKLSYCLAIADRSRAASHNSPSGRI